MKGLIRIPSLNEFEIAYRRLQSDKEKISAEEWALWSQWSRFDPRLAEQWIQALLKTWKYHSPVEINQALLRQPWPAAAGVLLSQAASFAGTFLRSPDRALFRNWCACVLSGVQRAEAGLFFIGLRAFGGEPMRQDAIQSLKPYSRWGYLGREILTNKASARAPKTWAPPDLRKRVLESLIHSRPRITVADYLEAIGNTVSRRQAQLDLESHPKLAPQGKTRGRFYVKKHSRR